MPPRLLGGLSSRTIARRRIVDDVGTAFRDLFSVDRAGLSTTLPSLPGPGSWTVNDVEDKLSVVAGALRGGANATPGWNRARAVRGATPRVTGRTFAAIVLPDDDSSKLAIGWLTSKTIADPTANGIGWVLQDDGGLEACTPNGALKVDAIHHAIRPMVYLVMVVLNLTGGYVLLSTFGNDTGGARNDVVGIPAYPLARIVWAETSGSQSRMHPYVDYHSTGPDAGIGYPLGHVTRDARVVDVPSWSGTDALATFADRFDRADTASVPANGWIQTAGTWGIIGGKFYEATSSGNGVFDLAYNPGAAISDGIFQWDITTSGTTANQYWGLCFRRNSAGNYMRLTPNGSATNLNLMSIDSDTASTIASLPFAWAVNTTYRVTCLAYGNRYRIFVNAVDIANTSVWITDAGNNHLTGTGIGVSVGFAEALNYRFGNIMAHPHTVTVPSPITSGAVPPIVVGGTTLGSDTFTDTNGVRLNAHTAAAGGAWTEHTGTWTIQGNRASSSGASSLMATQAIGAADVEISCVVHIPATLNASGSMFAGICTRYVDVDNWIAVRCVAIDTQANDDEIEIPAAIAGVVRVIHKGQYGADVYLNSGDYTLKIQVIGDLLLVFLDGLPRLSWVIPQGVLTTATRHGLFRDGSNDSGLTWDSIVVKALDGSVVGGGSALDFSVAANSSHLVTIGL